MKPEICFFSEDVDFSLSNEPAAVRWIKEVAKGFNKQITYLNFVFVSDEYLLDINREHLEHDYYTDIITFPLEESEKIVSGDIFISIERVLENASVVGASFDDELNRVMIHGVLHLIGFDDASDEQKKNMRMEEDKALSLRKF